MKIAKVKFVTWDKEHDFIAEEFDLEAGEKVIVRTESGLELGEVMEFVAVQEKETEGQVAAPIGEQPGTVVRKATVHDLDRSVGLKEKNEALEYCRVLKDKHGLPMKFIDAHYSFDNARITFAFIADGRVDFRELVKDMTRYFSRSIRLQQIGIRDEAKIMGDVGHCGKGLCCREHLRQLESITSEMAELQECSHRGSDRISGACGRLMCCLAYEQKGYEDMKKSLPPSGARVNVDGKRGVVVGSHTLKQTVKVEFDDPEKKGGKFVAEIDINRHKKK